jgi:hypothetical protein
MIIQDPAIPELIVRIADHYNANIATRFMRPLLAPILANNELSRRMGDITDHPETYSSQGVHIDDLYLQIQAMARFVYMVRTDILPNIRNLVGGFGSQDANKVYRDMAMSNFGANVTVLADLVHELYVKTVAYDKLHSGGSKPVYKDIPGLEEIGRYLVGHA